MFHPRFRHDIQTTAAAFYLTSSGRSARSSLYSRQTGVSGFWCHRLERPASPRRICAVTRGFQTTTQDLCVFPFVPRHYHMTRVLLSPFITTVWTPVVLAIINIIYAMLKKFMMMMMMMMTYKLGVPSTLSCCPLCHAPVQLESHLARRICGNLSVQNFCS